MLGLGAFLIIKYWRQHRPHMPKTKEIAYEKPGKLPPAFVGMLLTPGAEPGWGHALGTLFDLADRGVLEIDELPDKKWYRQHDFVIRLVKRPSSLQQHEQALLDLLFDTKKGWVEEIEMSKLSSQVNTSGWKTFTNMLKDEFEAAGYISKERKEARKNLVIAGVLLLALMVVLLIPALVFLNVFGLAVLMLVGLCFLLAMLAFIMSSALSPLSDLGVETAVTWQPFQNYLQQVSRKKAAITRPDIFELFMPYVASLGLLHSWAKRFEKEGVTTLPHYFHALPGSTNQIAAFVAMTAATQTSSGSAAGAGAAGAGAAGGGASGAG
ncbi:MAG: DUF2207 domain-containing protein [Chloroflexi bacterium]|nr:MAG: DUF2207 domain-containing protein [Chloroflexota bacterium]